MMMVLPLLFRRSMIRSFIAAVPRGRAPDVGVVEISQLRVVDQGLGQADVLLSRCPWSIS